MVGRCITTFEVLRRLIPWSGAAEYPEQWLTH